MKNVDAAVQAVTEKLARSERTWFKYRTLVRAAGLKRSSRQFDAELQKRLREANIFHSPTDLDMLALDDTLLVATTPFPPEGLPFADERELSEFVARHFNQLAPFRSCSRAEREHIVGGVRVDLYLTEPRGVVVCELEHLSGNYEPASQIRKYIEVAEAEEAKGSQRSVRGVVITGRPNPDQERELAEWCDRTGKRVEWYYYRLLLELEPAPLNG